MGSPPRGRGKVRQTPFCTAGTQDHPRMGGEKMNAITVASRIKGSPPRRRGKGCLKKRLPLHHGITPAWAGKRPCLPSGSSSSRDHPRTGGEKSRGPGRSRCGAGSPPHRRGKALGLLGGAGALGITPAWAGKSCCSSSVFCIRWDHPRVGGEKSGAVGQMTDKQGSPPRGRGKGFFRLPNLDGERITPAWAGKSRQTVRSNRPP